MNGSATGGSPDTARVAPGGIACPTLKSFVAEFLRRFAEQRPLASINYFLVRDFLLNSAPRMLKFSRARFCRQAGVHASGCAPHAQSERAAASQLGALRPHRRNLQLFF